MQIIILLKLIISNYSHYCLLIENNDYARQILTISQFQRIKNSDICKLAKVN